MHNVDFWVVYVFNVHPNSNATELASGLLCTLYPQKISIYQTIQIAAAEQQKIMSELIVVTRRRTFGRNNSQKMRQNRPKT